MCVNLEIPIEQRVALVADDHELFRSAISTILQLHCGFHKVFEVASLDEAIEKLGENEAITFATFDLGMPGINRAENLHSVRQIFPDLRAVVVAGSERRDDMFAAMIAGMHGYIPKTMSTPKIAAAFQMVVEGKIFLPWSVAQLPAADDKIEPGDVYFTTPAFQGKLTPRQRDVLTCIRAGKSNKEIARALGLTESTVKVHTNALYRTLGVRNRVGAASANID
ncbi:response regulator transcription factor [Beijerinckia sp. L45]|uniref:LuxR C-terminal-related transcriptional regulator n=1 Tax=Beijerinckia sp. L45 TaxID=1641855 RepID=UPI00131BB770|nr:response regulator transcription factor [Beijerinckia sp. L45]